MYKHQLSDEYVRLKAVLYTKLLDAGFDIPQDTEHEDTTAPTRTK